LVVFAAKLLPIDEAARLGGQGASTLQLGSAGLNSLSMGGGTPVLLASLALSVGKPR